MRVAGVQVARPASVGEMRTAFGKQPVVGDVRVGRENLDGDGQADRRHHGGPEMAVLAYSADHYPAWRAELAWPDLPLGGFGENLSVEGASETTVCIGDVWRVGTALLQVSSPRNPCSKISNFWRRPDLLKRVEASGRYGWYLRVLEEGVLRAGLEVERVERPHPDWTVARAHDVSIARAHDRNAALELASLAALSPRWKAWLI
jgi:MOSC domain-containing protein YiiM